MDLLRVSFLTTLNIYKVYFKSYHTQIQRPSDLFSLWEATAFVCHRVLYQKASRSSLLMKWRILQSTIFVQVAEVSHILGFMQKVSHRLEICALKEIRLLQDQVQLGIGVKVQL